ncbi:MAG: diguanylate cyclase [Myxococcota bacterium]|jgi:diguanylate cyclase (GGDEF)-like protein|nr:diguanylate cyclase [Myxococcota bacterium]
MTNRLCVALFVGIVGLMEATAAMAASELPTRIAQFVHRHWSLEEGLPSTSVTTLVQDSQGYLWIATREGLARFDGNRFTVFDQGSQQKLEADFIAGVQSDGKAIWFGIKGQGLGVVREDGQLEVFGEKNGLLNLDVQDIRVDARSTVWVTTESAGLYALRHDRFERLGQTDGLPSNRLTAIIADSSDRLWVGTDGSGLAVRTGNQFAVHTTGEGLPGNVILSLHLGRSGTVYVGTDKGLARFVDGVFEPIVLKAGVELAVLSVREDRDGLLWVGTDGAGLALVEHSAVSWYTTRDGLGSDRVGSIFQDRDGNVWVGTLGGGLEMFRQGPFSTYGGASDALAEGLVLSLLESKDGALWMGTQSGGLIRVDDTGVTRYAARANAQIISLLEHSDGRILAGTAGAGLLVLEKGQTSFAPFDGLASRARVSAMLEGPDAVLWIGLDTGLAQVSKEGIKRFGVEDGMPSDDVKCLALDGQGDLWIGTASGLAVMRDGGISTTDRGRKLPTDALHAIVTDGRRLWLGTESRGIVVLDRDITRSLSTEEGLLDETVFSITEDAVGRLWVTSPVGIYSFGKRSVEDILSGTTTRVTPRSYSVADGLRTRESVGGYPNAVLRTSDRRLWFATTKGVSVVDASRAVLALAAPQARIEEVRVDGVRVPITDPLIVPPRAKSVELRYSAATFLEPERLRFEHHLDGYDDTWRDAGGALVARYANLDAGDYTLRVKALCRESASAGAAAELRLRKLPTYYETWWFYLLVAVGSIGAVAFLALLPLRGARRRNIDLQDAVNAKTKELSMRNRQIEDLALRDPLTGLRNRRYLFEVVVPQTALAAARKQLSTLGLDRRQDAVTGVHGLAIIDLDDFKKLNDQHGHDTGDAVLSAVAQTLAQSVRGDDVVIRWGGEEFLVVLENTQPDFLPAFADKVLSIISQRPILHGSGEPIRVTCSIGLVAFPPSPRFPKTLSFEQTILLADKALERAKGGGKDRAVIARVNDNTVDSEQAFIDVFKDLENRYLGHRGGTVYLENLPRRAR